MTTTNHTFAAPTLSHEARFLAAPWGCSRFEADTEALTQVNGLGLSVLEATSSTLTSIRLADAIRLPAEVLEQRTIAIYRLLQDRLQTSRHCWPARFWNHLPGIHDPLDAQRDRYMVFNGGRFKAFCQWWGNELFPQRVPTASATGHNGNDLIVHCLSTEQQGIPIENPRQVPAFGYSKRYGPLPPCFARATLLGSQLLIGGTASIRGEQTMHPESLVAQTEETFANIASLVRAAWQHLRHAQPDDAGALAALTSVRVYSPLPDQREWIVREARKHFPGAGAIEFVVANLCRAELLIEIEGVASLSNS